MELICVEFICDDDDFGVLKISVLLDKDFLICVKFILFCGNVGEVIWVVLSGVGKGEMFFMFIVGFVFFIEVFIIFLNKE